MLLISYQAKCHALTFPKPSDKFFFFFFFSKRTASVSFLNMAGNNVIQITDLQGTLFFFMLLLPCCQKMSAHIYEPFQFA